MAGTQTGCFLVRGEYGAGAARGVWVEVLRGDIVESRHRVHVAVVDAGGRLRASAGEPHLVTFTRSAIKALQALPLVEDGAADRYGISEAELALCCASHGGESFHVEAAQSILDRIGETEDVLACGPHAPFHKPSARALAEAGLEPRRLHNNCSGKHAGMLALARLHDWPTAGYHLPDHPVQRRMLAEVERWAEVPRAEILTGMDGCGVVTFAVPLSALAGVFARLGAAARHGEQGPKRLLAAMHRHPEYLAGTDRLCTDIVRATGGRVVAKVGAEGVYAAGVPEEGIGIALKVEDGARRAAEPALLGVLRSLELISAEEHAALAWYAEPEQTNTLSETVGRIRSVAELEVSGG